MARLKLRNAALFFMSAAGDSQEVTVHVHILQNKKGYTVQVSGQGKAIAEFPFPSETTILQITETLEMMLLQKGVKF